VVLECNSSSSDDHITHFDFSVSGRSCLDFGNCHILRRNVAKHSDGSEIVLPTVVILADHRGAEQKTCTQDGDGAWDRSLWDYFFHGVDKSTRALISDGCNAPRAAAGQGQGLGASAASLISWARASASDQLVISTPALLPMIFSGAVILGAMSLHGMV
jgi:hypothetical protein